MQGNAKFVFKIIALTLLLIITLSFASCSAFFTDTSTNNGDTGTEPQPSTGEIEQLPSIYEYYQIYEQGKNSFIKLEVNKILDGVYKGGQYSSKNCILVECTALQDYYNVFNSGITVTIPVYVAYGKNINDTIEFVNQCDYLYAYTQNNHNDFRSVETREQVEAPNLISVGSISYYSIIPIVDGKVDLAMLDNYLTTYPSYLHYTDIRDFEKLIYDGMSDEDLSQSILEIYNYNKYS